MDHIVLIWQPAEGYSTLPSLYREKIVLPYGSLEEAKIAWEKLCEAILGKETQK